MAYPATKKISYWGQFGILAGLTGAGLIIGGIASLIPIMSKINLSEMKSLSTKDIMDHLLVPGNANALRWMQFITTTFLFFLPSLAYAAICHKKSFTHLGLKQKIKPSQVLIV